MLLVGFEIRGPEVVLVASPHPRPCVESRRYSGRIAATFPFALYLPAFMERMAGTGVLTSCGNKIICFYFRLVERCYFSKLFPMALLVACLEFVCLRSAVFIILLSMLFIFCNFYHASGDLELVWKAITRIKTWYKCRQINYYFLLYFFIHKRKNYVSIFQFLVFHS